jgi:two-component system CheB/CheR fusion protein
VQRISDLLGHKVEVRSWPGRGSVFAIEVPIGAGVQPLPSAIGKTAQVARPAGTVLIIEDDPAVREMLEILLDGEGYRTTAVIGADAALALAARRAVQPDVIIADYNLPGDLTGAEVIARLREALHRQIPAIILTGDISSDTLRKIAHAGCVYLSKPATADVLTQQVQGLLDAKPQPVAPANAPPVARATGGVGPTIFVVDDDRVVLGDMQRLLQEHGHAAEAFSSGEAFLEADRPDRKGCLVVDALMPGMSGIALLERLKAANRGLPTIMITGQGDISMAVQAMKAGAADFLEKPVHPDALLASIGRAFVYMQDSAQLSAWRKTAADRIARLTPRERDVLDLVVKGRPNKLIADDLGISQRTVENHRAAVMKRTGVATLPDLIRLVMAAADGPSAAA